jgi:hypothetical protein
LAFGGWTGFPFAPRWRARDARFESPSSHRRHLCDLSHLRAASPYKSLRGISLLFNTLLNSLGYGVAEGSSDALFSSIPRPEGSTPREAKGQSSLATSWRTWPDATWCTDDDHIEPLAAQSNERRYTVRCGHEFLLGEEVRGCIDAVRIASTERQGIRTIF